MRISADCEVSFVNVPPRGERAITVGYHGRPLYLCYVAAGKVERAFERIVVALRRQKNLDEVLEAEEKLFCLLAVACAPVTLTMEVLHEGTIN